MSIHHISLNVTMFFYHTSLQATYQPILWTCTSKPSSNSHNLNPFNVNKIDNKTNTLCWINKLFENNETKQVKQKNRLNTRNCTKQKRLVNIGYLQCELFWMRSNSTAYNLTWRNSNKQKSKEKNTFEVCIVSKTSRSRDSFIF